VQRFLREARAQFQIKSDHVVRVLDVGTAESGDAYIAMELLEGESLADVCEATPRMPWETACELVCQACEALESAHQLGIVHRDVKPANLMVCEAAGGFSRVKLLDFGIAQIARAEALSRLTMTETVIGTPLYMAPEQMRSARATDPRSDIWSVGVVLYRLLTGSLPFVGESLADLVYLQHHALPARVDSIVEVPAEIADAVARCLAVTPADRPASAADLAAVLAPFARPRAAADLLGPVRAARPAPLAQPLATERMPTPVPSIVPPASGAFPAWRTELDAAGLTFVRRKVHDTSGATAFAVHELGPRDERSMTTGPRRAPALPPPGGGVPALVIAAAVAVALLVIVAASVGLAWRARATESAVQQDGVSIVASTPESQAAATSPREIAEAPTAPEPAPLAADAVVAAPPAKPSKPPPAPRPSAARSEPRPPPASSAARRPSIYTEKW
jgi:eukaryotic-like serine/threonine-protein kinase